MTGIGFVSHSAIDNPYDNGAETYADPSVTNAFSVLVTAALEQSSLGTQLEVAGERPERPAAETTQSGDIPKPLQITYPIPPELLATTGSYFYFTGPSLPDSDGASGGQPPHGAETASGGDESERPAYPALVRGKNYNKVLAVYNPLDYRLNIATEGDPEQYGEYTQQYDGLHQLCEMLRALGPELSNAGDKAELLIRELIGNHLENVDNYPDRWFVISESRKGKGDPVLKIDYFSLEATTKGTFLRFKHGLKQRDSKVDERLSLGKTEGDTSGQSGRGIPLMVTLSQKGEIKWISHNPRARAARILGHIIRNQEGVLLSFVVNNDPVKENPSAMTQAEILASFGDFEDLDLGNFDE